MKRVILFLLCACLCFTLTACDGGQEVDTKILHMLAESTMLPQIDGEWFESNLDYSNGFIAGVKSVSVDDRNYLAVSFYPTKTSIQGVSSDVSMKALAMSITGKGIIVYYDCEGLASELAYADSSWDIQEGTLPDYVRDSLHRFALQWEGAKDNEIELPDVVPSIQIDSSSGSAIIFE